MIDELAEDHAAAAHQEEIVALMRKIEPCMHGHPRAIIIITLIRLIAALLGPASKKTREEMLHEIPITIRNILKQMDRVIRNSS